MLFSGDRDKAPRTRGGGLGWQKRVLLACSLVGLAGSLTAYATSAVALVGMHDQGSPAIAAAGMLTPSTGEADAEAPNAPETGADGAAATAQSDAAEAAGEGAPVEGEGAASDGEASASAGAAGASGTDEGASDAASQANAPAFPTVSRDGDAKGVGAGAAADSPVKTPAAETGKKPAGSSASSGPKPSGSQPAGSSGGSSGASSASPSSTPPSSGGASSSTGSGSSGGGSSTAPSASGPSSSSGSAPSGGSVPTSDGGTTTKPAASSSTVLSDATEQKICKQLTAKYEALAPLAGEVAAACATFDDTVDDASPAECKSALGKAKQLYAKMSEASSAMQSVSVPAKSKYHGAYADLLVLYDDLAQASGILRRAWGVACGSVDASGKTEPRQVVAAYADGSGKLEVLRDYEKRYPGARP